MKTVLILTDFSDNAAHAAISGVLLSGQLHANVLLFNTYVKVPMVPYFPGGPWVAEDYSEWDDQSKDNLNKLAASLQTVIDQFDSEKRKPTIYTKCGEGDLGRNVTEISHKKDIELIVMGSSSESTLNHILFGSDASAVIQHASCPVLVIPPKSDLNKINKVVFATDFKDADLKALHYLIKLGKLFNFKLEIFHVSLLGEDEKIKNEREMAFVEHVGRLKYPGITYKEIKGKDVVHRLNNLCKETAADLLAIVYDQHSFFMRILQESTTKKALTNQKMPLMILSSKME